MGGAAFALPIADYYRTDALSRASDVMSECSRIRAGEPAAAPLLAAE